MMFAVSGAYAFPGVHGRFNISGEAAGIVVLAARRFDRRDVAATLGAHIVSPVWCSATPLEERVAEVLGSAGIRIPPGHRMPATLPLPAGLVGNVPVLVLELDVSVGLEQLETVGRTLRQLRDEGVVFAGIAADGKAECGSLALLATVSLLLGAAYEDDRVTELGGLGFLLVPETDDTIDDDACCFWNVEAAGELPQEILQQLRPFILEGFPPDEELGENQDAMTKKKAPAIHVTRFDKSRLIRLLRSLDAAREEHDEIEDLERELERGTEVESTEVEPDVVTMNSTVRVLDLDSNTSQVYTIVFPADADFEKQRISILSPLGTALLGYRAGDEVTWEMPRGTRRLRIEELVYQPEAAGDFHL